MSDPDVADTGLTHFDAQGRAQMVDVSEKDVTERIATAARYGRHDRAASGGEGKLRRPTVRSPRQLGLAPHNLNLQPREGGGRREWTAGQGRPGGRGRKEGGKR